MEDSIKTLPLLANLSVSIGAFLITLNIIPKFRKIFIKHNLCGIDLNKKSREKIPEALGVVSGTIFILSVVTLLLLPKLLTYIALKETDLPHELVEYTVALFSIFAMISLGFTDDLFDLRWRYKVLFPTIATLPLLLVYYLNSNSTWIVVPKPLRPFLGFSIDLWILYYVYMEMLAVFCTNAINILAGINGLEVGQSLVIAISVLIFNIIELTGNCWKTHLFSIYFMIPYIATSLALFKHNWYPSKVFVGDTFCYFSGMTFAAVAILGHFSKTMLLFFIPQILNFLYSVPQLFHFVPCPRHRLPKYDPDTDKLNPSVFVFKPEELNIIGLLIMHIFKTFKVISWKEDKSGIVTCNNLTLINFLLIYIGPKSEPTLTTIMLLIQVGGTILAFVIRYPLAYLFYDV